MANTKISSLSAGSVVADANIFPAVETAGVGPVTKTALQIKTYCQSGVLLAANNLSDVTAATARTNLGLTALATTTPGTGVPTALAIAVGSAGAPVVLNGALGTPSSGTLTNATGLPVSTGVSGLGTGIATALGVNVGSAGAPVLFNGAGGTPASLTLTNATGLPVGGVSATGTPSSTTYLRGDGTWSTLAAWVRPADWPALPVLASNDQKFVGLIAVYNNSSNFVALSAAGNYTVDWGDGAGPQSVAGGTAAQTNYSYSASGLGPVTAEGYKTAIVTVVPQAGQNLTAFSLQVTHTQAGLNLYSAPWLDVAINSPNLTSIPIGGNTIGMSAIQQVTIGSHALTNMSYMFYGCSALESVPLFNTASVTDMSVMFYGCSALQSVPLFNTASVTDMVNMFQNCYALQSVPLFNTAAVTNMAQMFQYCSALQSVPLFNTAAVTNMSYMFYGCSALYSVPLFNTAAVTNMAQMFKYCSALQSVPLFNTASVTTMNYMFQYCSALQSVPLFNTAAVTTFTSMFSGDTALGRASLSGTQYTISYASLKLGAAEIVDIFNNLGTAAGAQTITVTGNWGDTGGLLTAGNITIATNKGWTVVA